MLRQDPTHCDKCKCSLADKQWMQTINMKSGEVIKSWCDDCDKTERFAIYNSSRHLSTRLLSDAILAAYFLEKGEEHRSVFVENKETVMALKDASDVIQLKAKQFEREVWFQGLQETINKATKSGVSAKLKGIKVLTFCSAGRCMITIQRHAGKVNKESVTFITDETSKRSCMGWQGVDGTLAELTKLTDEVIDAWRNGKLTFKEDTKVSYL